MTAADWRAHWADQAARTAQAEAPDRWWCVECGRHRANRVGGVCPCCQPSERGQE